MCSNYRVGICYRIAVFLDATPCKKKKDNHIKLVSTASFSLILDSTLPFCVLLAVISPRRLNYFNCWRVQFVFTDRLYNGLTVSKFFIIFILSVCSIPFCYLIKTPGDHKKHCFFFLSPPCSWRSSIQRRRQLRNINSLKGLMLNTEFQTSTRQISLDTQRASKRKKGHI